MPSNVFHNYFAKQVIAGLPADIRTIIGFDLRAFLVGAQGPDCLFYLRYEPEPLNTLGEVIHNSFNQLEMFKSSGEFARGNIILTSFLFGQLCHYALDKNLHPYVYHREKDLPRYYNKPAHKYIHVVFESALDYICVRDYLKISPLFYSGHKNLTLSDNSRKEISRYYSELIAPMYNMEMNEEQGEKMLKLFKKFMHITDDHMGLRYLLIRLIEMFSGNTRSVTAFIRPRREKKGEDWLNHGKGPYPKYRNQDELVDYTVEEMSRNAYAEAVKLITALHAFMTEGTPLDSDLFTVNYCGDKKE
jgi:hypothetical protein